MATQPDRHTEHTVAPLMTARRSLFVGIPGALLLGLLLGFLAGDNFDEGHAEGHEEGMERASDQAYEDGYRDGYDEALKEFAYFGEQSLEHGPYDDELSADQSAEEPESVTDPRHPTVEYKGTHDDPLPLGEWVDATYLDEPVWSFTVTGVDTDSEEAVLAAHEFNEHPQEGYQYVMFDVSVSYRGGGSPGDSKDPIWDFDWEIIGADGDTSNPFRAACGVIHNDFLDQGELIEGQESTANVCIPVATDQLDGATILAHTMETPPQRAHFEIP